MNTLIVVRNFFIVLLMGASCSFAETPADKPVEPALSLALYQSETGSGKKGSVDMARLFNEYSGTKSGIETLQKEMELKMPDRQALTAELERLSKEGGDAEAIKVQQQKIQLYDQQVQAAMDVRQNEVFTPIFDSIEVGVKKFGDKNGYREIYIEPREGAEDVTEAVLKGLK
jgi:Skp family chaperone for outer membrane proteins